MKISRQSFIGISIGILIFLSTFVTFYFIFVPKSYPIKNMPIIILQDDDFNDFDFLGDGTIDNPFLIDNYKITTKSKYSIFIINTFKYFVIQNCYVNGKEYGIYLDNIADGTATIKDNLCSGNEIGIRLSHSNNITITNNICSNNEGSSGVGIFLSDAAFCNITNNYCYSNEFYGIKLEECSYCYLFNNTCTENSFRLFSSGLFVFQSTHVILENNTCNSNERGYGIHISVSTNTIVRNNTCEENFLMGIYLTSSPYSLIIDNIISRNGPWYIDDSHGIMLQYSSYCNLTRNIINSNIGNGIYLLSSSNCYVFNNEINNQIKYFTDWNSPHDTFFGFAVYCLYCSYITILDNQGSNNYGSCWVEISNDINISSNIWENDENYSIEIYEGSNCTIQNNIIDTNEAGIHITLTTSSIVMYNLITNSESYGLSFYRNSSNNIVHHNSFINNNLGGTSQGYDEGIDNVWYENITEEGNYWTDWSGSGNYSIDGPSNSVDPYCLIDNPLEMQSYTLLANLDLFSTILKNDLSNNLHVFSVTLAHFFTNFPPVFLKTTVKLALYTDKK